MLQVEGAVVAEVTILNLDYRDRAGADIFDQGLLDGLPTLFVRDLVDDQFVAARLVLEHIELAHQIFGQIAAQEGGIALDFTSLEDLVGAALDRRAIALEFLGRGFGIAAINVFPDFETEMVGVDLAGA